MGYAVYIQKFENGDCANIPYDELKEILEKYGVIAEGNFSLEFVPSVGNICDYATLSGDLETGITGITFNRPTVHEKLPKIIYELLSLKNTCFFGPNIEFVHTRSEMDAHYPIGWAESLESAPKKIEGPLDSWPLK